MKVAIANALLPTDETAGVPLQVHHLANTLVSRGHAVTVFSFSDPPDDARYASVSYKRPRLRKQFWPFFMAYQLMKTDFSQFDVLHVHGDNYLLKRTRKHVRTFHGAAKDELRAAKTISRKLFFGITCILEEVGSRVSTINVGVSRATKRSLPAISDVVPCGVDLGAFTPGKKDARPMILFVGTEGGRKRGAWFADIFRAEVLPKIPNAHLVMITDLVGDEPGITRPGRVSQSRLVDLYASAWIFCLPSTYEGFGVPYIEAMASGTTVVATSQNPGAAEIIENSANGLLVDDASLGKTLQDLLSDEYTRTRLAAGGLARSRDFSWDRVAASYEEIYERLATLSS